LVVEEQGFLAILLHPVMVEVQYLELHRLFNALVVELELMIHLILDNQEDLELETLTVLQDLLLIMEKGLQEKEMTEEMDID
tara:strand:+ start:217 stop:462 length:246 start_codon:yes stop_codon:yes gene_type:complete